jgi:DNA-directed RNA polymerase subunit RPC12/RpoP
MNITYSCPSCEAGVRQAFDATTRALACPHCGQEIKAPTASVDGRRVKRCLVCPSSDLFVRKDFPQRLGVSIVAVGIIGSSIAWNYVNLPWTFGILFATALADLALFAVVPSALMCYRCGAQYRGVDETESHGPFNLETHEKYRQMAARLSGKF